MPGMSLGCTQEALALGTAADETHLEHALGGGLLSDGALASGEGKHPCR
jgi:hypothetical protein